MPSHPSVWRLPAALLCAGLLSQPALASLPRPEDPLTLRRAQAESLQVQAPSQPGQARQGEHVARQGLHPSQLPLRRAEDLLQRRERIGEQPQPLPAESNLRKRQQSALSARALADGATAQAAQSCQAADFRGRSGANLIAFIDQAALSGCMYQLYTGSAADHRTVFSNENMVAVANTLRLRAMNYTGTDSDQVKNLLSYLRTAGYWWYLSETGNSSTGVPAASRSVMNAALGAMKQLAAAPRFYDSNETNAYVVAEVFKTVPAGFAAALAPAAARWIEQFQPQHAQAGYWHNDALLAAMNTLFYGDGQTAYITAVRNDLRYARALDGFLSRNRTLLGTDNDYHLRNAVGEMLRFLRHPALKDGVRLMGVAQMAQFQPSNDQAIDVWLRAADMVDAYDAPYCASYGTCNAAQTLEQQKLPIRHACNANYVIRAQAMTPAQLQASCESVIQQAGEFHAVFNTLGRPVPNDNNQTLELVVFDSSEQYKRFSGHIFGNNTDNGGIYLEGSPWVAGNQARFIAHRAEWLSGFEIWNLNHEFVHYLDGRFNMGGGFNDYPLSNGVNRASSVWWIEGLAEYISFAHLRRFNADATSRAQTAPLALSEVMRNTYESGSARVYNWGYLAARYMVERQPQLVDAFLPRTRVADYAGYSQQILGLGTQLDADFSRWLNECVGGGQLQSSGCLSQRPGTLPLVDANAVGPCRAASESELGNGCARAVPGNGGARYYYLRGTGWNQVLFRLAEVAGGGADVYAKAGGWATAQDHQVHGEVQAGGAVQLNVPTNGQGWIYVTVVPRAGFAGATLRGMYSALPFGQ
ncbi:collagenase [Inhella sp.]|uniref:collagenase n=1 Tax=Inhella sp. TaxID=1921806 RepID=UPI0035B4E59F